MSERIALLIDVQNTSLLDELRNVISEDRLLARLSDDPQSALEYITITDRQDYDCKSNETVIYAGEQEKKFFTCCPPEAGQLKSAVRRAYCHWETANMNKAACNSVQEYGESLESIAQGLSWKAKQFNRLKEIRFAVADQSPVATAVVDQSGVVCFLNSKAHQLFQGLDVNPLGRPAEVVFSSKLGQWLSAEHDDDCHVLINNYGVSVRKAKLIIDNNDVGYILAFI